MFCSLICMYLFIYLFIRTVKQSSKNTATKKKQIVAGEIQNPREAYRRNLTLIRVMSKH